MKFQSNCLKVVLFLCFSVVSLGLHAQASQYKGTQKLYSNAVLNQEFAKFQVFDIETAAIQSDILAKGGNATIVLELGAHQWSLRLEPSRVMPEYYSLTVQSDKETITTYKAYEKAFVGTETHTGGDVRLVVDTDYIGGYVEEGKKTYYIEPVRHFDVSAPEHYFVVYEQNDVLTQIPNACEAIHPNQERVVHQLDDDGNTTLAESRMICLDLQLAIASDKSMFTKYGSVVAVENHNITVMNNVQTNYTGQFLHDINFVIVTQFVVTGTDPWSPTTVAGDFLASFRTWGNAGNFGVTFDIGQIWTNRDFDGTTIGVAYVGGLCTSFKYQALQDFSTNAALLRVMTAHETGHNFDMDHDTGNGFIMSPSVSNTNTWSSLSVNTFATFVPAKITSSCLVACAGGGGGGTPPTASFTVNPSTVCIGQPVTLTNTSTGNPTSYSWNMPTGTPSTSTATNPTVTYGTVGTKTITLTATNSSGSSQATQTVTVIGPPTAAFTSTVNGLTASFTYTGSSATGWTWNFGDGFTSNVQNPIHTYANPGTYTVTLTVSNACGSAQLVSNVTTGPVAAFTSNVQSGCAPLTVQFTNQSQGATSWSWQFQGGTPATSTLNNPTVTYNIPGSYDVTLIVTNSSGSNNETKFDYIVVSAPPVANFTSTVNGSTVIFTNTSSNGSTYLWNFGDGNISTAAHPTHAYLDEGVYTVTLTVTNPCGVSTITHTVQIVLPPTASFAIQPNSGCAPLSVQFTSTSSGANLTYNWQFPGGNPSSSSDANPVVTYVSPGNHSVTLSVNNSAGANTASQPNVIQVEGPPATDFVTNVMGFHVDFTNLTSGGTTYAWTFGDGGTSTATNPSHTYATDGTYNVVLTSTNACGVSTYTETVIIASPPVAVITASQTSGCAPTTVQYTGLATAGVTHQWTFAGGTPGTSTAQNPTVTYNSPGSFTTTYVVINAAGSSTATQAINMGAGATPVFSVSTNGLLATFTNNSSNATSFTWDFGDGMNSNLASPTHTYAQDGNYTVVLSATNACGTNMVTQTVVIVTPPTAAFAAVPASGCAPLTVQFNNQSSANSAAYSWSFSNGAPVATTASPQMVFTNPGTYNVVLTVSNPAGTSTSSTTVTVNGVGTASFTNTVSGALATFTNTSTNATSYTWEFGDGQNSTQMSPTHTYVNDGTYTVTLTAINACGSNTTTQTVAILTPPSANFAVSTTTGCGPLTINYTNQSSSNVTSFQWTFAGGNPATSTDQNPIVVYNTPGIYTTELITTNGAGSDTETKVNYITVSPMPTASMTASVSGAVLSLTNTSTNATSYLWNFGDGQTSTQNLPTHTYAQDGTYTVSLTTNNICGSATATQTVVVVTPPSANFAANTTSGCGPLTVAFNNLSSANATTYAWIFAGGTPATSSAASPTVVYNTPGTYAVVLTSTNAAGSATSNVANYITVNDGPQASFGSSVNGAIANFTNTSTNATAYAWTFGDGDMSTAANPSHTYATDGVYTVILTATNACGSITSTSSVTVVLPPMAGFTSSALTGCAPHEVQFTNASSPNATAWAWTFAGGTPATSTVQNPTVTWANEGTYQVSLTVTNAAGANTTSQTVVVNAAPQVGFTPAVGGLEVGLTNTSIGATSYAWTFGDGGTSTVANPTHTYAGPGQYIVTLVATNGCGTSTSQQTVSITGSAPTPGYTSSGTVGCAPLSVQYMDASIGDPSTWAWTFGGGNPATSNGSKPDCAL